MKARVKDYDQFQVRLPEGMRERIKADADANGRSMNTEVVARLEKPAEVIDMETVMDGLYAIARRLDRIEAQIAAPSEARHHHNTIARMGGVLEPSYPHRPGGRL